MERIATAKDAAEVRDLMLAVEDIFLKYAALLQSSNVALEDLVFWRRAGKGLGEYAHRSTIESDACRILESEGKKTRVGEAYGYVIVDSTARHGPRTLPVELLEQEGTKYDLRKYVALLARTCNTVLTPFGHCVGGKRGQMTIG